jgi:hypothetical protein
MSLTSLLQKLDTYQTNTTHKRIQAFLASVLFENPEITEVDVEHQIRSIIGYWPADVYFVNNYGKVGIIEVETSRGEKERAKVLHKFYTYLSIRERKNFLYFAYPMSVRPPYETIKILADELNVNVPFVYRVSCDSSNNILNFDYSICKVYSYQINGGFNFAKAKQI